MVYTKHQDQLGVNSKYQDLVLIKINTKHQELVLIYFDSKHQDLGLIDVYSTFQDLVLVKASQQARYLFKVTGSCPCDIYSAGNGIFSLFIFNTYSKHQDLVLIDLYSGSSPDHNLQSIGTSQVCIQSNRIQSSLILIQSIRILSLLIFILSIRGEGSRRSTNLGRNP